MAHQEPKDAQNPNPNLNLKPKQHSILPLSALKLLDYKVACQQTVRIELYFDSRKYKEISQLCLKFIKSSLNIFFCFCSLLTRELKQPPAATLLAFPIYFADVSLHVMCFQHFSMLTLKDFYCEIFLHPTVNKL